MNELNEKQRRNETEWGLICVSLAAFLLSLLMALQSHDCKDETIAATVCE